MGLMKKLFGKTDAPVTSSPKQKVPMTPQEAVEIIQVYGVVLENAPPPGNVADEKLLPFPKQRIKEALLIGLKITTDQKMREMLKYGYTSLPSWQAGVGDAPQGVSISQADLDPNKDITELASRLLDQWAAWEQWEPVVKAEEQALIADLKRLGF